MSQAHIDTPVGPVKIGDPALDGVRITSSIAALGPIALSLSPLQRIGAQQAIGLVASLHHRLQQAEAKIAALEGRSHG